MADPRLRVVAYGDAGLLVSVVDDDPEQRWRLARALQVALLAEPSGGVSDVVASFDTAFVTFDPGVTDHDGVRAVIGAADLGQAEAPSPRTFVVPVVYGGAYGPDLQAVAVELGLTPAELVALHTGEPWTVRLRGSPAVAPMTDGPRLPADVARNPTPRTRLEPGSVGLSGQQCMVYPVASPGGWRIIGRTPVPFVDLSSAELVAYRAGDRLHFTALEPDAWDAWTTRRLQPTVDGTDAP